MIERYTRPEMGALWTPHARFQAMLDVEVAVAKAQAELQLIPRAAAQAIAKKASFRLERIVELEKTTKHDVIAFVSSVAENVGDWGRFIHFGMTSSDVLDTALSLQIKRSGQLILKGLDRWSKALETLIEAHESTICSGRTHGMHAEPTTFGYKLAGFWSELQRNRERMNRAVLQASICKLSGAVGTYSSQPPQVEALVAKRLGLQPESVATQVIPRDRHAEVVWALSMVGAGIERLAVELRHLQRTEVNEAREGFSKGQKGSSAMPHKRNPISAENLTGVARLLRGYLSPMLEDIALWHERDISHSAVERVAFADAWIIADYGIHRLADLLSNLEVDEVQMQRNVSLSQGMMMSSHLLLALVDAGLSREDAYKKVQSLSHSLKPGESLEDRSRLDDVVVRMVPKTELNKIFSGKAHLTHVSKRLKKIMNGKSRSKK